MADLQATAVQAAQAAGVDPNLYVSLIANGEGGFANPNGVSPKGARGPPQLMPATAASVGVKDINDPTQTIYGGARYLRQQMDTFGDPSLAVAAYNAGPGAVHKYGGVPPYRETQDYVRRVMGGVNSSGSSASSDPDLPSAETIMKSYGWTAGQPGPDTSGNQGPTPIQLKDGDAPPPVGTPYTTPGGVTWRNSSAADTQATAPSTSAPSSSSMPGALPSVDEISKQYGWNTAQPPSAPAVPKGPYDPITGALTTAFRAIPGVTELGAAYSAALHSGADLLAGKPTNFGDNFNAARSDQNAEVGQFQSNHPVLSNLASATGMTADTIPFLGGGVAAAAPRLTFRNLAANAPRLATAAAKNAVGSAAIGAGYAFSQPGTLDQRSQSAVDAMLPSAVLGAAAPAAIEGSMIAARGVGGALRGVVAPYAARFSPAAAEAQAGRYIAGRASDLPAVQASLARGPNQIIPGSMPTTFQQTGDMGLGSLERATSARNPAAFTERAAGQNAARVQALGGVQSGADPQAVSHYMQGVFDDLDKQTQARVDALTGRAQAKTVAVGGTRAPDEYGSQARDAIEAARQPIAQERRDLFDVVDPDGTLTANSVATSKGAAQIASEMPATAKPMSGEEAAIFQEAQNLPPATPARDLIALRQRVNAAASDEMRASGRTPSYARLTRLQGVMQDNLANTVSDAVMSSDRQAASGIVNPEDALSARIAYHFGDPSILPSSGVGAVSQTGIPGGVSASDAGPQFAAGSPLGAPRLGGAAGQVGGGYGGYAGGAGLSPEHPELAVAEADIRALRGGQKGGLFRAMQELGGVKLRGADGSLVAGPDVSDALGEARVPGTINNQTGLPPEQMAQALHERGFFGPQVSDPSAAFEQAVANHAAGRAVYAQGAYEPGMSERLRQIDQDATAARVTSADRVPVAAQKLADYRRARSGLLARSDEVGVDASGRPLDDVWGDVAEREAIQGGAPATASNEPDYGAEFDRLAADHPTFDAAATQRLKAANSFSADYSRTYGAGPVADAIATRGYAGDWRLRDGLVPGKFFHPGPTGFQDMQSLLKASPEAAPIIQDYAASTLRRAAMNQDGTLDAGKFSQWKKQHEDAIKALPPEQIAKFSDAASASKAVADAAVQRAQTLKAAQGGAIGKIMGAQGPEEVTRRIGTILGSPTAVTDMGTLAKATAGNPEARAGLRQALADYIASKFIGNTEAGTTGVGTMKADPFQTFVRNTSPALSKVFTPAEMESIQNIAADIARSKRSQTAVKLPGGSNTAQDTEAVKGLPGHGAGHTVGRVIFDMLAAGIGEHLKIPLGSELGLLGGEMANAMRSQGIEKVNDLVSKAMLDPVLARTLLQRVKTPTVSPKSMQGSAILRALSGVAPQPPRRAN